jgi:peroxiredoxin Q/BCP
VKMRRHRTGLLATALVAAACLAGPAAHAGDKEEAIMLEPGQQAPGFSLTGSDGETYTLDELAGEGPVIIAWFPSAFTGG